MLVHYDSQVAVALNLFNLATTDGYFLRSVFFLTPVQCKDSDQCLLDGEVAVHAEHCQKPWIGLGIREYVKTLFHILIH